MGVCGQEMNFNRAIVTAPGPSLDQHKRGGGAVTAVDLNRH